MNILCYISFCDNKFAPCEFKLFGKLSLPKFFAIKKNFARVNVVLSHQLKQCATLASGFPSVRPSVFPLTIYVDPSF